VRSCLTCHGVSASNAALLADTIRVFTQPDLRSDVKLSAVLRGDVGLLDFRRRAAGDYVRRAGTPDTRPDTQDSTPRRSVATYALAGCGIEAVLRCRRRCCPPAAAGSRRCCRTRTPGATGLFRIHERRCHCAAAASQVARARTLRRRAREIAPAGAKAARWSDMARQACIDAARLTDDYASKTATAWWRNTHFAGVRLRSARNFWRSQNIGLATIDTAWCSDFAAQIRGGARWLATRWRIRRASLPATPALPCARGGRTTSRRPAFVDAARVA
jgi:hypothetical protein